MTNETEMPDEIWLSVGLSKNPHCAAKGKSKFPQTRYTRADLHAAAVDRAVEGALLLKEGFQTEDIKEISEKNVIIILNGILSELQKLRGRG